MEKAHTVSADECELIHFTSHPLLNVVVGPLCISTLGYP